MGTLSMTNKTFKPVPDLNVGIASMDSMGLAVEPGGPYR